MALIVQNPRSGCALHGGLQTVEALPGVVPILHANTGCGIQSYLNEKANGRGAGYISGNEIPGTCSQERHIIFGGASRLREQIKNTIKIQSGKLYVVLNSCEAAMVGDDVESMVEESVEQGNPVIATLTAGFQGDSHVGYENVFVDLLKKVPGLPGIQVNDTPHEKPVVNIFGILPATDTFWQGDVDELIGILDAIGVEPHAFLNSPDAVQEIAEAGKADLSIVFSKWGIKPAAYLEQTYGVPIEVFDSVPSGIKAVTDFVRRLQTKLAIDTERAEIYLKQAENYSIRYLHRLRDIFYEKRLNRRIFLVGEESGVTAAASVLHDYLRTSIAGVVLTDQKNDESADHPFKNDTLSALTKQVIYSGDLSEIQTVLERARAEMILGSTFEREYSITRKIPFVEISEPVTSAIVLNKSYAGVWGALRLTEDYINAVTEYEGEET